VKRTKKSKIKTVAKERPRLFRDPTTGLVFTKGIANGPTVTNEDVRAALGPAETSWTAVEGLGLSDSMFRAYVELYRAQTQKHLEGMGALMDLNGRIAEAALETFESARGALNWLTSPEISLKGRTPLDVARTKRGTKEVITLLKRIDRGIAT
jgi:antitoxin Xre/MbcA/ParS-like protein